NLAANLHRHIETPFTQKLFRAIFPSSHFVIHDPLPAAFEYFDEGAANHTRFCVKESTQGLHFFVWGRSLTSKKTAKKTVKKYPARQTQEAQAACVRLHKIDPERVVFAEQNPAVIDKGVFHNDVIATGYEHLFFVHEEAYVEIDKVLEELQEKATRFLH